MVKEMFETFKKFDNCVITAANSLGGLRDLIVKTAAQAEGRATHRK
jgi:hypothetical protein